MVPIHEVPFSGRLFAARDVADALHRDALWRPRAGGHVCRDGKSGQLRLPRVGSDSMHGGTTPRRRDWSRRAASLERRVGLAATLPLPIRQAESWGYALPLPIRQAESWGYA